MPAIITIVPNGSTFGVQKPDGSIEQFADILKRVKATLHQSLQCDLRIVKNEANGNYQLSFDNSLFVGVDRNLPREENDKRRSTAIGKRFALLGALANEFAKMGLKFGEHISPRDTRQIRDQQSNQTRWGATTQMWINIPGQGSAAAASVRAPVTDEDLMSQALGANPEKAETILDQEKNFDDEGKLKVVARARLRALVARAAAVATPDVPAPETEDKPQESSSDMPTD